ncbi:MAG: cyclase family protein [Thermonemataceae bacterium]|nr:cyclase family protein [Thermonemataceae bacterium]
MKKVLVELESQVFVFDLTSPIDISIPLQAGKNNPNCYFATPPLFSTIKAENFVGSVKEGGSCNYQELRLTPHGNGTHTECYGHISDDGASINQSLNNFFAVALLVSVAPRKVGEDFIVFWEDLNITEENYEALIIRTLPNLEEKLVKDYNNSNPPYLSEDVGRNLAKQGVKHLLVDLPSVDKEVDGGVLACHKAFWQYPQNTRKDATISELIYVPSAIQDGIYLLNLQIISLETDASPSKPILYKKSV